VNQTAGFVPSADSTVKLAMPASDPMMSIAYAFNGGMLLSSGPSGSARVARSATTSETTSGRIRKSLVRRLAFGEAEEELVLGVDLDIQLHVEDERDDDREEQRERRDARVEAVAADQDAQADAQERARSAGSC